MSVYIKGMEMPQNCMVCPLHHCYVPPTTLASNETIVKAVAICMVTMREINAENCPLVPIPEHGRLIDADALLANKGVGTQIAGFGKMYHETCIEYAPTIIPAD